MVLAIFGSDGCLAASSADDACENSYVSTGTPCDDHVTSVVMSGEWVSDSVWWIF